MHNKKPGDLRRRVAAWQKPSAFALLILLLVTLHAQAAQGVPLAHVPIGTSQLNVEDAEFVGTGQETTYLVIDFGAGGGGSFAFGYRHDGQDTAEDMLNSFAAAGVLEVFLEDFFGPAVRGIVYPREEQEEVFPTFDDVRSWILWDGLYEDAQVEWSHADVGLNGMPFDPDEPTVVLPNEGFYGLSTWPSDDFFGAPAPLLPLPGDFDSDGIVDGDDLLDALLGFGTTAAPTLAAGDADRDGDVDRADLRLWQENAGAGLDISASAASIPEPSTLWALAIALTCLGAYRLCGGRGLPSVSRDLR